MNDKSIDSLPIRLKVLKNSIEKLDAVIGESLKILKEQKALTDKQLTELEKMQNRALMDTMDNYQRFHLVAVKIQNELKNIREPNQ